VQRTNEQRAALLFVVLTLSAITVVCGAFLLADAPIPEWFVIAGRWLPALLSLLVLRIVPLPGGLARWWALRPGGWRRLLGGSAAALGALVAAYALTAVVVTALGVAHPQPWSTLGQVAVLLVPMVLVYSLSTFGEEAAWRGFLQQAWGTAGFWRTAAAVSAVWVAFHVPLHGAMALQGTLPATIAVVTTLVLFPLGLFLSAVVTRFGSVWPAVFAHALPFSALNLLTDVDALPAGALWTVTAVTAAILAAAAALFAPRRGERAGRRG
jgi:uncharacterized protein